MTFSRKIAAGFNGVSNKKPRDAIGLLQEYARQNYLFHGSPRGDLGTLSPQSARDTNPDKAFNIDTAVFASQMFDMCIPFSLIDRDKLPDNLEWKISWRETDNGFSILPKFPEAWRSYLENDAKGYVYVLPPGSFTETDGAQWKSRTPVTPVDRIEVTLKDLLQCGAHVEWISAPSSTQTARPAHKA